MIVLSSFKAKQTLGGFKITLDCLAGVDSRCLTITTIAQTITS